MEKLVVVVVDMRITIFENWVNLKKKLII